MLTYALEKLIEAHNDVGYDRESDHHIESRMAAIRREASGMAVLTVEIPE